MKFNAMKSILLFVIIILGYNLMAQDLPETFDLRDFDGTNYVTSVKSQSGGTCWTHGAMASIEGNLMISGNWDNAGLTGEPDLSEYHLDWWNGFNSEFNQDTMANDGTGLDVHYGGDYRVTSAYLSRGEGAIKDTTHYSSWYSSPPDRMSDRYNYFYVRDIEWYTMDADLNGIEIIKRKVMEHGVMGTCMAYDGDFIYQYMHYQPPSSDVLPNHAVAIIGWNDTIDVGAPNPGAWLVKNSWGDDWGYDGYFWISYYDKWAGREPEMGAVSHYNVVEPFYDDIYYHDYHGWRDTREDITSAFNAFTASDTIEINAISFFTSTDSVNYIAIVFDSFDGVDLTGELGRVQGTIDHTGFHTIDLENEVIINKDDDFYIYVYFDRGGHAFDRTSEVPVLLGGNNTRTIVRSTSSPGESFFLNENGEWADFYYEGEPDWINTGNFCMKALVTYATSSASGLSEKPTNSSISVYPLPVQNSLTLSLKNNEVFVGYLKIVNISGQVIYNRDVRGEGQFEIDTRDWAEGMYFYYVETSAGNQIGKIIKQ
jgi:C1A family cysteine protease